MHHDDDRDRSDPTPGGTDDRANRALPVTAEVGGEGGSYADPTIQVPTFRGPITSIDSPGGAASVAGDAIRFEQVAAGGVGAGPDPAHGMIRYPSEDPASAPAADLTSARMTDPASARALDPALSPARRSSNAARGLNWRGGVIGAVAGLAGAALAGGLSRRRRRDR
jgi:hypothetical protein